MCRDRLRCGSVPSGLGYDLGPNLSERRVLGGSCYGREGGYGRIAGGCLWRNIILCSRGDCAFGLGVTGVLDLALAVAALAFGVGLAGVFGGTAFLVGAGGVKLCVAVAGVGAVVGVGTADLDAFAVSVGAVGFGVGVLFAGLMALVENGLDATYYLYQTIRWRPHSSMSRGLVHDPHSSGLTSSRVGDPCRT